MLIVVATLAVIGGAVIGAGAIILGLGLLDRHDDNVQGRRR